MPNSVSSHNDRTLFKVLGALTADGEMDLQQAMQVIDRIMAAGILFREPAERETKASADQTNE